MSSIGFIGAGNMAQALINGIIQADQFAPADVLVSDISGERLVWLAKKYGVVAVSNNTAIADKADIIVLSVKPQVMAGVLEEIKNSVKKTSVVISIAAGITVAAISEALGDIQVIRVMPNTPSLVSEGMSGLYSPNASDNTMQNALEIFSAVGKAVIVEKEDLIDAVTAISGSGPAYFFLLMEEMIKTAQKLGLPEDIATDLVLQTAKGAAILAEIAQFNGESAEELRRKVTSPGGTTEAAINTFKNAQLDKLVEKALTAAYDKSKELSG
ncbi:MAG: pyrroline-5-carboxylate reductase [Planctomycetes bacterium]|nr:pyrroline-5-carboxylate reductase [Planctomycetota bacterium]